MLASARRRAVQRRRRLAMEFLEPRTMLASAAVAGLAELQLDRSDFPADRLLVGLRPGSDVRELSSLVGLAAHGARPLVGNLWELELPERLDLSSVLAELESHRLVAYAEPDYTLRIATTPNDALFGSQWALHNTGQGRPPEYGGLSFGIIPPTDDPAELVVHRDARADQALPAAPGEHCLRRAGGGRRPVGNERGPRAPRPGAFGRDA